MKLQNIKLYTAPNDQAVIPYEIKAGINEIELITDGEVFLQNEHQAFGPGSLFWHQPGDKTVYLTSKEKPYSCVNFIFLKFKDNQQQN